MAEIAIVADPAAGGELAADEIAAACARRPDTVLGVPTGTSARSTWQALEERHGLDMSWMRVFALGEYVGLPAGHPASALASIDREIVAPLRMDPGRVHVPYHVGEDPREAPLWFERDLDAAGGVDVQLLGIGTTGHIGFNEPGSSLTSTTRLKTLHPTTRANHAQYFDHPDQVPVHCVTQGLGTIGRAQQLILLAWGEEKALALAAAVEGPVTSARPGSVIQLHRNALVIADEAAASMLIHADYYRFAWDHRDDVVRIPPHRMSA